MTDTLRSRQFDDIYFSPDGGLEETRHVFLKNNYLLNNKLQMPSHIPAPQ
jgi:tRNA U34 5-methylaminomethyl-2-thiouridine-forming methyltransferase MnmC